MIKILGNDTYRWEGSPRWRTETINALQLWPPQEVRGLAILNSEVPVRIVGPSKRALGFEVARVDNPLLYSLWGLKRIMWVIKETLSPTPPDKLNSWCEHFEAEARKVRQLEVKEIMSRALQDKPERKVNPRPIKRINTNPIGGEIPLGNPEILSLSVGNVGKVFTDCKYIIKDGKYVLPEPSEGTEVIKSGGLTEKPKMTRRGKKEKFVVESVGE